MGRLNFRVLFVPGHSPGHVAFLGPGNVFSGDCLFAGSIGRTDLPGGDQAAFDSHRAATADLRGPDTLRRVWEAARPRCRPSASLCPPKQTKQGVWGPLFRPSSRVCVCVCVWEGPGRKAK